MIPEIFAISFLDSGQAYVFAGFLRRCGHKTGEIPTDDRLRFLVWNPKSEHFEYAMDTDRVIEFIYTMGRVYGLTQSIPHAIWHYMLSKQNIGRG
tara:strand:+ start:8876 stop:9160 length:285 start_codon:yes stop_codon:yes gene_type:complete